MIRNYDKSKIELEKVFIEYHHKQQVLDIEANHQKKKTLHKPPQDADPTNISKKAKDH